MRRFTCGAGIMLVAIGCGPGSTPVEQPDVSAENEIRLNLQTTIENGNLGSEMMNIESAIDELAAEQPTKAAELQADLIELQELSGAKAKAKAKAMIDELE